ncbi:hypothetical protein [Bacillus thuringiensis]|uniref:NADH dehydrogenase n=1 Tax=Bacillus thuringiensis serovar toumanoffi TaxID=180862 RepID=A0ABD5HR67_BACTU|nr:hypothetical protein [Bacillus thuringiensis]MCR6784030.1 hypothetical protein [Bacillus thuringiensis]MCR6861696.1 hypothetical protein [Bacillus thuringiensis]MCR6868555.1 hypothetical protein [Bacillus thuringiensis]MDW9207377.1 hypothetical protein [Bacillus thuringiensis serovar toumanoffi]MED2623020.1 hypothetical protein [Bacillus thuringiensis]
MDILNILDEVSGISSFILAIYILLKESKEEKISVLNAKVPADQAENLSEENASHPIGNSTNWLGFSKKYYHLPYLYVKNFIDFKYYLFTFNNSFLYCYRFLQFTNVRNYLFNSDYFMDSGLYHFDYQEIEEVNPL